MLEYKFKEGDKVLLDPNKCDRGVLADNGSDGTIGHTYTIRCRSNSFRNIEYMLGDHNWHKEAWLTRILVENVIGGKLNGDKPKGDTAEG